MKVLICGGTGFIGRNLVDRYTQLLEDPNSPVTKVIATRFKRPIPAGTYGNVGWWKIDLRDPKQIDILLNREEFDVILQFAATTSGSKDIVNTPHVHVTDNAVMNSYLFRAAHEAGVKHFVFPSCTVMYPSNAGHALQEYEAGYGQKIISKYFGVGNTKVYCEQMANFYSQLGNTKFTVIRHSNIYGPYDKYDLHKSHVFGATITKVLTAVNEISIWGTGQEGRDFLHVHDLVNFIELAIKNQNKSYGLFNVGCGKAITINALVKLIIDKAEKHLKITHDLSKPAIPTTVYLDCTKAEKEIKWKPHIDLPAGIKSTINWWKNNINPKKIL